MADVTKEMIKGSLDALVNENCDLADDVRQKEFIVDSLNDQIFRELLTFMPADTRTIHRSPAPDHAGVQEH